MGFFLTLLIYAAFFVLSEVLKPKPENENARPAGLGDFDFPTTTEERVVPLIWGTVKLSGPNVVWYGDLRQRAIEKHIKISMFSSDDITIGYKYYIGVQLALCRGPVDSIQRIWIGDDEVWSGSESGGDIDIHEPNLFGGTKLGNGGVSGTFEFKPGSAVQTASTYLSAFQQESGDAPAYRGTCYGVFKSRDEGADGYGGGYIGSSSIIKPWHFEVRRLPLGPTGLTKAVNSGNDANLAYVVYEFLTNTEWGLGFPAVDIDATVFNAVADTLVSEGNGFSFVLDRTMEISSLLEELQRQMDGVVFLNQTTGKWTIKLARNDYVLGAIPALNETNVKETIDFARSTWFDTTNYVTTQFKDRDKDYFGTFGLAQDIANFRIQGGHSKSNIVFPGVKDRTLANALAWRELRALSFPLAKAQLVVDRSFWDTTPVDVFKWSSAKQGFTDMVVRVSRVDLGELVDGKITLTVTQDVYANTSPVFGDPFDTGWTAPASSLVAIPANESIIIEAPRAISIRDTDPASNSLPFRIWAGGRYQLDGAVEFDLRTKGATGVYVVERVIDQFMLIGELVDALGGAIKSSTIDVDPDPDSQADIVDTFSTIDLTVLGNDLTQLIMVDNEFMLVTSAAVAGGDVRLANVYRGVLDSAIATHALGASVYLLFVGGGIGNRSWSNGIQVNNKLVPRATDDELAEGTATTVQVTMANRHFKPYPPIGFNPNTEGDFTTNTVSLDANGSMDAAGINIVFDRRDYLEYKENARHISGDAVPSEGSTVYQITIFDESGAPAELFTVPWNSGGNNLFVERTLILQALLGVLPTALRGEIETKHTLSAVDYEADQQAVHTFDVESPQLTGDFNLGLMSGTGDESTPWTTVPDTGTYTFDIGTALTTGAIQGKINSGSWVDVITVGNTTGDLTGVTAGDTITVKANGGLVIGGGRNETILTIDSPSSGTDAYGILEE